MLYINVPVLCFGYFCLVYDRYCTTLFLCLWFYVENIFILHGPLRITRIHAYIHMHFDFFKRFKKKINFTLQFKLLSFRIIHKIKKTQPAKSISELLIVYPEVQNKSIFLLLTAKICSAFIPTDILTVHLEKMTLNWKCQPSSIWALFLSSL